LPWIRISLSGYQFIEARSLHHAEKLVVAENFDLFLLDVHFDDSKATELVNIIRRNEAYAETPIVIVRIAPSEFLRQVRETMVLLRRLERINGYLEVFDDESSQTKLRNCIAIHLS